MKPEEVLNDIMDKKGLDMLYNISGKAEYAVIEAMKEFGKLAFEAGREYRMLAQDYTYHTFEDYLKELYGEK